MKKLFLVSIVLLGTLVFTSCEREPKDTERPVIDLIGPEAKEAIKPGSDVHFEVKFSDNIALASYKVNIHGNFKPHTHIIASNAENDSVIFDKTWLEEDFINAGERESINGKKEVTIHHHKIVIPATIDGKPIKAGPYHFMVYCTDKAGNESFIARDITISYSAADHDHHH